MPPRRITITLEISVDEDELRGSAADADGEVRPFAGWIGLITAIDALVEAAPDPARALHAQPPVP